MFAPSQIELSRSAYHHNIDFIRNLVGPDVRLSCVVKGNAYGHGIENVVPLIEEAGVEHVSVYNADEALRVVASKSPATGTMIMGAIDEAELAWAIEHGVEFYVFRPGRIDEAVRAAREVGEPARVHLQLETGMNRLGLTEEEVETTADKLDRHRDLIDLVGVATHFAGAERMANHVRVMNQFDLYRERLDRLADHDLHPTYRHVASSAASLAYPKARLDMVRVGILQYGFWPSTERLMGYLDTRDLDEDPLRRVITWKSRVMGIKEVAAGSYVGYGNSYLTREDSTIASVPVGYADGFARSLSNHGRVLINEHRAPVVGKVSMNMLTADVTEVPETTEGDEVVLIGEQGEASISVAPFGERQDRMNYERLAKLSTQIPRQIVD